jgi:hypothetical protein
MARLSVHQREREDKTRDRGLRVDQAAPCRSRGSSKPPPSDKEEQGEKGSERTQQAVHVVMLLVLFRRSIEVKARSGPKVPIALLALNASSSRRRVREHDRDRVLGGKSDDPGLPGGS